MKLLIALFLALIAGIPGIAQNCADLEKTLDSTYNFKPSKLSPDERDAKSLAMDAVWTKIKSDRSQLSCLRSAFLKRRSDKFFRFDISNLLIQLDDSDDTRRQMIEAYSEVDLDDVDQRYWMRRLAILGFQGYDVSPAGDSWLRHADPGFFLPEHGGARIDKKIGALSLLGSMDESMASNALVRFVSDEKHPGRDIALDLLLLQATEESDMALRGIPAASLSSTQKERIATYFSAPILVAYREGKPKSTREEYLAAFTELSQGKTQRFRLLAIESPDGDRDVVAVMTAADLPLIRKCRRIYATVASPELPDWYLSFTAIIETLRRPKK